MPPSPFQFTFDAGLGLPQGQPADRNDGNKERGCNPGDGQALARDATLYPIAFDPDANAVQFVELTREEYSSTSFLDSRIMRPDTQIRWRRWEEVCQWVENLPTRCHFIFHISHVGSTLLSRLVGQHPAFFSVREPAILRTFAEVHASLNHPSSRWTTAKFDDRLTHILKLWSRVFEDDQIAVIKATSFVAEIAEILMDRVAGAKSILMFVQPATFLKALLDGAMSDISGKLEIRSSRLHRRLGTASWQTSELSAGESVAMSWLCEMLGLDAAARRFADRVLWIDFDAFLNSPEIWLAAALRHIGAKDASEAARRILAGPLMTEYAKAPGVPFDASTRARLLQRSEDKHRSEIRKGLDWLKRVAVEYPVVKRLLERSQTHTKS